MIIAKNGSTRKQRITAYQIGTRWAYRRVAGSAAGRTGNERYDTPEKALQAGIAAAQLSGARQVWISS